MSTCPACGSSQVESMGGVGPVPVLCGSLWDSREEALATPTASLDLAVCRRCAHVWNTTFNPALVAYDASYDNTLDFSPTFRNYAGRLVERLVDTYDLHGKRVAEIGSGKGEFLRQLCGAGQNRGVGYDPTYVGPDHDRDIEFVRELFTPHTSPGDIDFVCCRHVLEHVVDPVAFLRDIRAAVRDEPVPMYFEVPNAEFNFAETGPWDLIYPHVAYFSEISFCAVLSRAGFRVRRLEPCFDSQFLGAEVVPSPAGTPDRVGVEAGEELAASLSHAWDRQRQATERWRVRIDALVSRGPVALWGAGSKGVTFLSLLDSQRRIGTVVDANPRKWGMFLPGAGHQVVAPEILGGSPTETLLVMNRVYAREIASTLRSIGATARIEAA